MRMTAFEKYFVNRPDHTAIVASHAQQLLERTNYQPGWRYLDVGCGVGAAARSIAGLSALDVTGIDVDPKQIEAARAAAAYPNLHFLVMDATRLDFADSEFDVVAARMATHHIHDWQRVLLEMVRVLRSGGYLIYSDFVFPQWLAKSGQLLIPLMGFPTIPALDSFAAREGLRQIYESRSSARVDVVWIKKA